MSSSLPVVVLAVDDNKTSLSGYNWVKDDPLSLCTSDIQLLIVHAVTSDDGKSRGDHLLAQYKKFAETDFKDRFITKTKLLYSSEGVGPAIKHYTNEIKPLLVVASSSNPGALKRHLVGSVTDYLQHHCQCPLLIVKKDRTIDIKSAHEKSKHVGIALDANIHSDRAVDWFLAHANLPKSSTLVFLHVVKRVTDKVEARKFLASYKPKCIESKKDYTMKSGLVYFKGKKPDESILKYTHDYNVDLLIVASRMQGTIARHLHGSMSDSCVHGAECDVMVWKDEQTRRLSLEGDPSTATRRKSLVAETGEYDEYDVAMMEVAYGVDGYEKLHEREVEDL